MQAGSVVARIEFEVRRNNFGPLAAMLPTIINRVIREQVFISEGDVKTNIIQYNAVDTGNMLNSTKGEMLSPTEGLVSVSAQSGQGYPYPVAVNFGTVHVSPRPFFSDAETTAQQEFPRRMVAAIDGAV